MVVCGDDTLAHRLAGELRDVYGERVTLVIPPVRPSRLPPAPLAGLGRASAFFGRMSAAMARTAATLPDPAGEGTRRPDGPRVLEAAELDEDVLVDAGVDEAAALALVHDDDEINIRVALAARRLNPQLRLVIRLYNRKLGQHLEELLDQAAAVAVPGLDRAALDATTTVLSDADTAAPALAATAVAGTSKVVRADGLLLRAVERNPPGPGEVADPGLCTLALLSATTNDPAGAEGSDNSGQDGPRLLPDDASAAAATGRGTVVLEAVSHAAPDLPPRRLTGRGAPLASLFSRRLRWSFAGIIAAVLALAVVSSLVTGAHPLGAMYLTLLDLFAIGDPAVGEPAPRQVMQLLAMVTGILLLPVVLAAVLEALGTFRTASALRRPPRGISGHVVLLGLGKIGSRVLVRLRELGIPVVCVEEDPDARGIALARSLRVPTVLGDVTQEGVLEAAKIERAHALLALTSVDTTNLEAALYARSIAPDLRVALRLYDDDFATAVYRTLRAAHPGALTRSRSVSTLAAPAFAIAMMGRQILGAIPVERKVLLMAAIDVAGHPRLEGRTVAEVFRPGAWRVIALDTAAPGDRVPDLADTRLDHEERRPAGLVWDLHPGYVLHPRDRVVLAATRRGLAELLGRQSASRTRPAG
ncbi:NAD-binding protein [Streptomyces scopuliridis]|uniref:NAD-binding protein n=1 Tax=Streptomyces scopuliridis TaxID=452529 RepID=A0ACD4ZXL2_9ACTN|nr:NAD-binding protein [Streptomyces scopuliridis]WSB38460.1 NAD-binding protein [Streptomyces scopuliridis]WSC02916.1 NAD-binding protein [Streptomyces scopuliridis]WSC11209.1 NAD-binding protein [Streptomyces scopuliridis]